ncbi:MAG: hypothetical protein V4670_12275 [Bacteroidota bacterium]
MLTPYIQTIRTILIVVGVALAIWFFKDWQFQKSENIRQTENARQLRISDSLKMTSQVLTTSEIKEYLEYQNKDLKKKLESAGIKENKVQSIITNNYYYKDTITQTTDVSPLIKSIINGTPDNQTFQDTTKCQTTKGKIVFDGKKLEIKINDREFKNKTDAVVYQERKQWQFLGIKTRFLGRRQFTSKLFDDCGSTTILKIEKKKD